MKRAFVFPGQGSQTVGMGRALREAFPSARRLFEEVDEALSQHLGRLIFEGPEGELTLTQNAQPALMAVSLAVIRVIEEEGGIDLARSLAYVAGHSLGEYSALAAAHALEVGETARLLRCRGEAMQKAVPVGEGAMAALIGLDLEAARSVAEEARDGGLVCAVANDNAPGQIVLSGHAEAVDRAIALAALRGARRAIRLPVSAPFHSPLMAPAAEAMAEALEEIALAPPRIPLIGNVSASATRDPEEIKKGLVEQTTAMVRWRETILFMKGEGVEEVVEIGAGRVLSGLLKRIDRETLARSVGEPGEVEALLKDL